MKRLIRDAEKHFDLTKKTDVGGINVTQTADCVTLSFIQPLTFSRRHQFSNWTSMK